MRIHLSGRPTATHSNHCIRRMRQMMVTILSATITTLVQAGNAAQAGSLESLKQLSLEDLANIEVSIASRTPTRLADTAAAVFVITQEDLRRAGITTLPEALRMVPGIQVARLDDNKWAISARGFNGRFANKLLVLMDGRTVYSPTFSGVFWTP